MNTKKVLRVFPIFALPLTSCGIGLISSSGEDDFDDGNISQDQNISGFGDNSGNSNGDINSSTGSNSDDTIYSGSNHWGTDIEGSDSSDSVSSSSPISSSGPSLSEDSSGSSSNLDSYPEVFQTTENFLNHLVSLASSTFSAYTYSSRVVSLSNNYDRTTTNTVRFQKNQFYYCGANEDYEQYCYLGLFDDSFYYVPQITYTSNATVPYQGSLYRYKVVGTPTKPDEITKEDMQATWDTTIMSNKLEGHILNIFRVTTLDYIPQVVITDYNLSINESGYYSVDFDGYLERSGSNTTCFYYEMELLFGEDLSFYGGTISSDTYHVSSWDHTNHIPRKDMNPVISHDINYTYFSYYTQWTSPYSARLFPVENYCTESVTGVTCSLTEIQVGEQIRYPYDDFLDYSNATFTPSIAQDTGVIFITSSSDTSVINIDRSSTSDYYIWTAKKAGTATLTFGNSFNENLFQIDVTVVR